MSNQTMIFILVIIIALVYTYYNYFNYVVVDALPSTTIPSSNNLIMYTKINDPLNMVKNYDTGVVTDANTISCTDDSGSKLLNKYINFHNSIANTNTNLPSDIVDNLMDKNNLDVKFPKKDKCETMDDTLKLL